MTRKTHFTRLAERLARNWNNNSDILATYSCRQTDLPLLPLWEAGVYNVRGLDASEEGGLWWRRCASLFVTERKELIIKPWEIVRGDSQASTASRLSGLICMLFLSVQIYVMLSLVCAHYFQTSGRIQLATLHPCIAMERRNNVCTQARSVHSCKYSQSAYCAFKGAKIVAE